MPFGIKNAPATFQRLMNIVTHELEGVMAYLDDVVVVGTSWQEHMARLRDLFTRLDEAGLTVNLQRSEFALATLTFLGHVVGRGQIAPVTAKVEAIQQYPVPENRKALRRYLGMAGYYRRYCPNFAKVVAPLTDVLSPRKPFVWSPECHMSFNRLHALLFNAPVL